MNKNIKKIISMVAAFAIVAAMGLGAFSYFTDYATSTDKAVAGTFDIDLTHAIDLDGDLNILNPGDVHDFNFTVSNEAQKSADIYAVVTVVGTAKDKDGNVVTPTTASPYMLLIKDTAAGYDAAAAEVTTVQKSADNLTYVYTLPVKALNGNEEGAIHETASGAYAVNADEFIYEYEIGMDLDALNEWEGSEVDVKIEIYAKQHENTASVTSDLEGWKTAVTTDLSADHVDKNTTNTWG